MDRRLPVVRVEASSRLSIRKLSVQTNTLTSNEVACFMAWIGKIGILLERFA